jgi:hypothetical protein
VDLFGSYLVGNGGKIVLLAEIFHMGDQFHRSGSHQADVDGFALGDVDVHGRIHVDEVVAGQDRGLEGLLDTVHGVLDGPFLGALLVLEPGSAVVDGHDDGTGEVDTLHLKADHPGEFRLRHARVTAVAVDLVERGGEIDGSVVTLGGADGSADDGRGVRAGREDGAAHAGLFLELVDPVEQLFGFSA